MNGLGAAGCALDAAAPGAPPGVGATADGDGDAHLPVFCKRATLILGCGNILFGDDGFGCELVDYIERHYTVPEDVCLLDVGTGVRKLLFTLCISPVRPQRILVLDALDVDGVAGEIMEIDPAEIPHVKLDDFSMHQIPTSNLLHELATHCGVEVRVLACQHGPLPGEVRPGLSDAVRTALPLAAAWVAKEYFTTATSQRLDTKWTFRQHGEQFLR